MNIFAVTALINVITSIILGFLVLLTKPKDRTNQTFFLFALSIAVWGFFYFLWQISSSAEEALMWVQLLMAGAIFIPFFYFHFIARFLKLEKELKFWIVLGYCLSIFFIFINWTPMFIAGVAVKGGFLFWPIAGKFFLPFLLAWVFYAIYPAVLLFNRARKVSGSELQQIKFILTGTAIGYIGGVTNYFLWYDLSIPPYGNISASLYIILVAVAIMKYQLFNMKVIATELLVFVLWLFVFIRMLIATNLQDQLINGGLLGVLLIVGVLLIRSVDHEVKQREKIEVLAKDLEKANVRLKELDKRKSEFVSIASHQLRSPLTAMKGYASMLLEGSYGSFPEKAKDIVSRILESTNLMVDSVEDFLNVSRIEQGRMRYNKTDFDIAKLAETAVDELTLPAKKKGLSLSIKTSGEEPFVVNADLGKIKQVFHNLIDNSIKYTVKGTIEVFISKAGKNIQFKISDTGVGISKETLSILFDKFVRADNAHHVDVSGTGLGLYVAKQMVEAHGGKIWVESDGEGKGSSFFVELKAV